jgi:hypothetical protein
MLVYSFAQPCMCPARKYTGTCPCLAACHSSQYPVQPVFIQQFNSQSPPGVQQFQNPTCQSSVSRLSPCASSSRSKVGCPLINRGPVISVSLNPEAAPGEYFEYGGTLGPVPKPREVEESRVLRTSRVDSEAGTGTLGTEDELWYSLSYFRSWGLYSSFL